jgi:hypothetical protein
MNNFRPGDKVRILEHYLVNIDLGVGAMELAATKGSIGTIVSYEEYTDHIDDRWFQSSDQRVDHLWWVRTEMSAGTYYPVRFEKVVQPSDDEYAHWNTYIEHLSISCQVGAIRVLPARSFVVL